MIKNGDRWLIDSKDAENLAERISNEFKKGFKTCLILQKNKLIALIYDREYYANYLINKEGYSLQARVLRSHLLNATSDEICDYILSQIF